MNALSKRIVAAAVLAGLAATLDALCELREASAACSNGAPLDATHTCQIHLVTGPIFAPNRILALGGAYQGIAEGLSGYSSNAASPAVRTPYSWDWFDLDVDASISLPTIFRTLDLEFGGLGQDVNYSGFVYLMAGVNAQMGPWGFGVLSDLQRYDLTKPGTATEGQQSYRALLTRTRILFGRTLFGGDLVVGGGFRYVGFDVTGTSRISGESKNLVTENGLAPEIGFLYRPDEARFRVGGTFRAGVSTGEIGPTEVSGVGWLPRAVHMPWELDVGVAAQAGPRPLNIHWRNPRDEMEDFRVAIRHSRERRAATRASILAATPPEWRERRAADLVHDEKALRVQEDREISAFADRLARRRKEQYLALPRSYLLMSFGMLVMGPTSEGISLESFFTQKTRRAGAVTTFSPRVGLETEIANRIKPRIGSYVEPSQFTEKPDWTAFRMHFTAGFDVNLFEWTVFGAYDQGTSWRITTAVDVGSNYFNYGLSFGVWR